MAICGGATLVNLRASYARRPPSRPLVRVFQRNLLKADIAINADAVRERISRIAPDRFVC